MLFVGVGMIMVGFGLEKYAANTPYFTQDIGDLSLNIVLKYFVSNTCFLGFGLFIYIVRRVITLKMPTSLMNFIDLLSVSNISLFI